MVSAVAQGLPLKGVFAYLQKSPMAVLSPIDAPIKTPKELEGKTWSYRNQDAPYSRGGYRH